MSLTPPLPFTLTALLTTVLTLTLLRLSQILSHPRPRPSPRPAGDGAHLLIVLGSGGHTAEMIAMLEKAFPTPAPAANASSALASPAWGAFSRRTWIVGSGDVISAERARGFEEGIARGGGEGKEVRRTGTYEIYTVPRAREIHQPVWTAPVSCLRCAGVCGRVLMGGRKGGEGGVPDVILCNGPATAAMVMFTSVVLRFLDVGGCHSRGKMRTVYVESWARVRRLSLSGWLLSRVVDRFLVQWPQLVGTGGRAEFIGVLV